MLESGERGFGRRCCGQCVNKEAPDFSAGAVVEAEAMSRGSTDTKILPGRERGTCGLGRFLMPYSTTGRHEGVRADTVQWG